MPVRRTSDNFPGYLRVDDVPKYVRIGSSIRVKADGQWLNNGQGREERIEFFDSLVGYTGAKHTNSEGNAYLRYTISGGPSRPGYVWAINKEYYNVCSMKAVYFQQGPRLSVASFDERTRMVTLDYEIDQFSRNAVEGGETTIAVTTTSAMVQPYTRTTVVSGTRGSVSIRLLPGVSAGVYTFTARMSDGEYDTGDVRLGAITTPCATGAKTVVQTSPGMTMAFDGARFCGSAPGGTQCRFSVRPLHNFSYPPLEYTCL